MIISSKPISELLDYSGDDSDAKDIVSKLVEEIGFTPVDTGSLREGGHKQQPGSSIYNHPMTVEVAYKRLDDLFMLLGQISFISQC